MKPKSKNQLTTTLLVAIAATAACVHSANAATFFWDGTTGNIVAAGNATSDPTANGVWNTSTLNWDQSTSGLAHVAWSNSLSDTAVFAGTARTVTASGTLDVGKLDIRSTAYVFTGGTLNFSNGTIDVNATTVTGSTQGLISNLSGSVTLNATGHLGNSAQFISAISGNNTGLTSFQLNANLSSNQLGVFSAGAVGSTGSTLKLTKGLFGLSAANGTTYNSWATELAGGVVRLRVAGTSTYSGNSTLTANSALSVANLSGILDYTGTINLNANTLSLAAHHSAAVIDIKNVISGMGNITVIGDATNFGAAAGGTVRLSAANTFSGIATNSADTTGVLALNHVDALQNATLDTGTSTGKSVTFTVAGTNTYNIGALQGSDALAIGGNTISVGSKAGNTIFGAAISGTSGSLTKVGTDKLTLNAANTYSGTTTVTNGTLALGASGSIANSPTIILGASTSTLDVSAVSGGFTLGAAQTLSGIGTVTGAMTVAGTISPGNSPGILATGNETWSNGGDYNWQILNATGAAGTGFDQTQVTGTLDLSSLTAGGFSLNLWSLSSTGPDVNGNALNFNNAIDQSWIILTTSGGISGFDAADFAINVGANNGTSGFSNALGGGAFSLNTVSNNLVLNFTAVPEPSAALLGGLGLLVLLRRRR